MGEIIQLGHATFTIIDNILLYCKFSSANSNYKFDIDRANLYKNAIVKLCNGVPLPFLIDLRGTKGTFTISAANLLANDPEIKKIRISEAFITNTMAIKLLIYSYKRLYDPITPFAVYSDLQLGKEYCIKSKKSYDAGN